jgi:hypothetical protein
VKVGLWLMTLGRPEPQLECLAALDKTSNVFKQIDYTWPAMYVLWI